MQKHSDRSERHLSGDKVRIRNGPHTGAKGTINAEVEGSLEIQLETGDLVRVGFEDVTNYSRAARRAWQVMPKKAGRPRSTSKQMVSIRLETDVWERIGEAVELGLIPSREYAVNIWLRERLEVLFGKDSSSSSNQEE